MFIYASGLDRYIDQRRQKVIDSNQDTIDQIRALIGVFNHKPLVEELTIKILESIERCFKDIESQHDSTLLLISNLRFLFETCITTRILVNEESFKYKLRYSIYKHQLEKSKSLKEYALIDRNRLDALSIDEAALEIHAPDLELIKERRKAVDKLYDDLDKEISIFLDMAEYNGADFHKTHIDSFLSQHEEREKRIENEWAEVRKELLKNEEAKSLFDFKGQASRVEKELKDSRSWKSKAESVGLLEMYNFIYDYTSSLLHSTSYSLLVPNQLEEPEKLMILGLATRITRDALTNLCKFSNVPNMKVISVDS
ncbi:hypothetical protein [Ferrimonas balearica]|uniref:hypothetical protein n=1 Tax=Ferrimonas balearica TaxID=44012 RepID=UPI001C99C161|nr:hypothetical protein [Ferrimonas balearica]MBY5991344.1 hypothetical protein [Ferrimonas balearica]